MTTEITKFKNDTYNCDECVIVPPIDIYETDNEYVIKAEIPGVKKEDIDITLENKELIINGKINGTLPSEENLKYSEFRMYNYHRKFIVGEGIDSDKLIAGLDNGILTINLPKKEEIKPRKIEVTVEH